MWIGVVNKITGCRCTFFGSTRVPQVLHKLWKDKELRVFDKLTHKVAGYRDA